MKQLFQVGEPAILQSLDAPHRMWNARVTVKSVRWIDNPLDTKGMPQLSTFVYTVDICDRMFAQSALRKIDDKQIEIKEQTTAEIVVYE